MDWTGLDWTGLEGTDRPPQPASVESPPSPPSPLLERGEARGVGAGVNACLLLRSFSHFCHSGHFFHLTSTYFNHSNIYT